MFNMNHSHRWLEVGNLWLANQRILMKINGFVIQLLYRTVGTVWASRESWRVSDAINSIDIAIVAQEWTLIYILAFMVIISRNTPNNDHLKTLLTFSKKTQPFSMFSKKQTHKLKWLLPLKVAEYVFGIDWNYMELIAELRARLGIILKGDTL